MAVNGSFSRSSSTRHGAHTPRAAAAGGFSSPRFAAAAAVAGAGHHRKWFLSGATSPSLNALAAAFFLASLSLVLACAAYLYVFHYLGAGGREALAAGFDGDGGRCDVFSGSWVRDDAYPLYNSSLCPFAERGFNCLANGREDTGYLRWRWKPRGCDVPRFDAHRILEELRGKRIVFVGDSMSRTQWESLICMLMAGVEDPASVYEVNGNKISKTIRFLGVRFESFNLSVEFFRSVFLVQQGKPPMYAPNRVQLTLMLDRMDEISREWVDSDVLVFNSGHWWTPTKLFDAGCYFQAGGLLKLGVPITTAFKMALETWASWVETMVNANRTRVFFRTFEPSHWSGSNQSSCELTQQSEAAIGVRWNDRSEFVGAIAEVVAKMQAAVTVLNVTMMGASRSDAHIGTWSHPSPYLDCSHWCLPGVPDAWNELLLSHLLANGMRKFGS